MVLEEYLNHLDLDFNNTLSHLLSLNSNAILEGYITEYYCKKYIRQSNLVYSDKWWVSSNFDNLTAIFLGEHFEEIDMKIAKEFSKIKNIEIIRILYTKIDKRILYSYYNKEKGDFDNYEDANELLFQCKNAHRGNKTENTEKKYSHDAYRYNLLKYFKSVYDLTQFAIEEIISRCFLDIYYPYRINMDTIIYNPSNDELTILEIKSKTMPKDNSFMVSKGEYERLYQIYKNTDFNLAFITFISYSRNKRQELTTSIIQNNHCKLYFCMPNEEIWQEGFNNIDNGHISDMSKEYGTQKSYVYKISFKHFQLLTSFECLKKDLSFKDIAEFEVNRYINSITEINSSLTISQVQNLVMKCLFAFSLTYKGCDVDYFKYFNENNSQKNNDESFCTHLSVGNEDNLLLLMKNPRSWTALLPISEYNNLIEHPEIKNIIICKINDKIENLFSITGYISEFGDKCFSIKINKDINTNFPFRAFVIPRETFLIMTKNNHTLPKGTPFDSSLMRKGINREITIDLVNQTCKNEWQQFSKIAQEDYKFLFITVDDKRDKYSNWIEYDAEVFNYFNDIENATYFNQHLIFW